MPSEAVCGKFPQKQKPEIPSFPRRWESRSVRTGTYAPSFSRKQESRFFGTETYRIKRFL
ncbi:hypothetical protein B2G52_03000 [Neisseria lactamica]|uniref:PilS cassette n=1 Tax=Neisseria lactamica TaxID=486 RepID=A0AAU8VDD8_NEILA|nr:hypothetical protein B2G52_03000 [Neisseria lactamica]